jgi:hypothetical protein
MVRRRRTLHQVFCDEGMMPIDHQFIWHVGIIYRKVNFIHETNENILFDPVVYKNEYDRLSLDCDMLAECCREVFPEELVTLEVLFGK